MHDLSAGVHAGVGPAGGDDGHLAPEDIGQSGLARLLDRAGVGLTLPASIAGAVVFEDGHVSLDVHAAVPPTRGPR